MKKYSFAVPGKRLDPKIMELRIEKKKAVEKAREGGNHASRM